MTRSRYGAFSSTLRLANEFLISHSLSEILPYRSFERTTQIFHNMSSRGFVIETLPLVGCGEEIPRQLTGLFQHSFPQGSNLQCLLIASSRIESWLTGWNQARRERSDVLEELSKERCSYLRSLSQGKGIRTFRVLISYSESISSSVSMDAILSLREQFVTTLKGWGLPVKVWHAEDLLRGLDELLNPTEGAAEGVLLDAAGSTWQYNAPPSLESL